MEELRFLQVPLGGLILGGIYALTAVGLNLVYGTVRLLNIAHGELIMLGAYTTFWLFTLFGVSPLLSLVISLVALSLLGIIIFKVLFTRVIRVSASVEALEANSLLLFFALSVAFQSAGTLAWTADLRSYIYMSRAINVLGVPLAANRLVALGVAVAGCLGCWALLHKTMLGRAIRAMIQDRETSELMGINPQRIYLISFALGFAMAGIAGSLLSLFYTLSPQMGMPYTITAFIIVVLGGLGNLMGSLLGGFLLGMVETVGVSLTSPAMQAILTYSIFILVILIRPRGIFGRGG